MVLDHVLAKFYPRQEDPLPLLYLGLKEEATHISTVLKLKFGALANQSKYIDNNSGSLMHGSSFSKGRNMGIPSWARFLKRKQG